MESFDLFFYRNGYIQMNNRIDARTEARRLLVVTGEMGLASMEHVRRLEAIKNNSGIRNVERDQKFLTKLYTTTDRNIDSRIDITERHLNQLHSWKRLMTDIAPRSPRRSPNR